jgi:hypothetical protein
MTISPINSQASYLPPDFDMPETAAGIRMFLKKRERLTATIINVKENANYEKREFLTGQQWFSAPSGNAIQGSAGFRLTFDLVALNGGSIANGSTTTISLQGDPTMGTPTLIQYVNGLIPLHGFGACTNGTTYYFINDPSVYVNFTNTSTTVQSVNITNNTGGALTQCYWVFEYLKT